MQSDHHSFHALSIALRTLSIPGGLALFSITIMSRTVSYRWFLRIRVGEFLQNVAPPKYFFPVVTRRMKCLIELVSFPRNCIQRIFRKIIFHELTNPARGLPYILARAC